MKVFDPSGRGAVRLESVPNRVAATVLAEDGTEDADVEPDVQPDGMLGIAHATAGVEKKRKREYESNEYRSAATIGSNASSCKISLPSKQAEVPSDGRSWASGGKLVDEAWTAIDCEPARGPVYVKVR